MIEASEACVIAAQITQTLTGRTVTEAIPNTTPPKFAFFHGHPAGYAALLGGRTLEKAKAVGGMVEVHFNGNVRLVFSDGSRAHYIPPGGKLPQKHQLLIAFDDESCLVFCVQMYGMLWVFPDDGSFTHDYYRMAQERPNPCSESFTEESFRKLATEPALQKKSVKALLATEQRIPGWERRFAGHALTGWDSSQTESLHFNDERYIASLWSRAPDCGRDASAGRPG